MQPLSTFCRYALISRCPNLRTGVAEHMNFFTVCDTDISVWNALKRVRFGPIDSGAAFEAVPVVFAMLWILRNWQNAASLDASGTHSSITPDL
jgi:hypothetical protein